MSAVCFSSRCSINSTTYRSITKTKRIVYELPKSFFRMESLPNSVLLKTMDESGLVEGGELKPEAQSFVSIVRRNLNHLHNTTNTVNTYLFTFSNRMLYLRVVLFDY